MRGDAASEGTRRSQRQRIDLSVAEEGFDRTELERALRASLTEAQQREKEGGGKGKRKAKADRKNKTPKKPEPVVESKKKPTPPKRKLQPSASEKSDVEDVKPEKKPPVTPAKKPREDPKKETKTEVVKPKGKAEVKKEVKEEVAPKKETSKVLAKEKTLPKKPTPKSTKGTHNATLPTGREHALGKRLAHTQASDFITLLACATKVLGGVDQSTDYVLS